METKSTPSLGIYLEAAGQQLFALAVTRLQAAFLLKYAETGKCPSLADFDKPPLSRLLLDPYAGKPMLVEPMGKNRYRVKPAIPLWKKIPQEIHPTVPDWILKCPGR